MINAKTSIALLILAGKIVFTTEGHIWLETHKDYGLKKVIKYHNHLVFFPKGNKNPEEIIPTGMLSHSKELSIFKVSDVDLTGKQGEQHITAFFRLKQKYIKDIKEHPNGKNFIEQNQEKIDQFFETISNTLDEIPDN